MSPLSARPVETTKGDTPFQRRHEKEIVALKDKFGHGNCCAVAEAMNSLGLYYHFSTKDQDLSLKCHMEALHILRRVALAESAAAFSLKLHLGLKRNLSDEQPYGKRALSVTTVAEDAHSPRERKLCLDIATTLTDIGNTLKKKGDVEGAIENYQGALDMFQSTGVDEDNFRVQTTIRCMRNVYKIANSCTTLMRVKDAHRRNKAFQNIVKNGQKAEVRAKLHPNDEAENAPSSSSKSRSISTKDRSQSVAVVSCTSHLQQESVVPTCALRTTYLRPFTFCNDSTLNARECHV